MVEASADTIGSLIEELEKTSGIKERLLDESGDVRRFVNVYVNGEDIRFLDNRKWPSRGAMKSVLSPLSQAGKTAKAFHDGSKESPKRSPKKDRCRSEDVSGRDISPLVMPGNTSLDQVWELAKNMMW